MNKHNNKKEEIFETPKINSKQTTWTRKIAKGNAKGTGWITLPLNVRKGHEPGKYYNCSIITETKEKILLTQKLLIIKNSWGFYIPQKICLEKKLLGTLVQATIKKSATIPGKVEQDQRVRLPIAVVQEKMIKEKELYEIELQIGEKLFTEIVIIKSIDRGNRNRENEYYYTIRMQKIPINTEGQTKIKKKIELLDAKTKWDNKEEIYIPELLPEATMGKISEKTMVIFLGNHKPIITPITILIEEYVHYFGCYYADGTKKGTFWRINASTREQGKYYLRKYSNLIINFEPNYWLTYTKKNQIDNRNEKEIKLDLKRYWENIKGININPDRIIIIESDSENIKKWNEYGSLDIRDNKGLVRLLHVNTLNKITKALESYDLIKFRNFNIWNFLFGVLEGDGNVFGGMNRFGVEFTCHVRDEIISRFLTLLKIHHNLNHKDDSTIKIYFTLTEVLKNIEILHDKIFTYYPKRRKIFINRLFDQSTVKHLLKKRFSISPQVFFLIKKINQYNPEIIPILEKIEIESIKLSKQ
jgi:hypothetical protein